MQVNKMEPDYQKLMEAQLALGFPGIEILAWPPDETVHFGGLKCLLCKKLFYYISYEDCNNHLVKHSKYFDCKCIRASRHWIHVHDIWYWVPCSDDTRGLT